MKNTLRMQREARGLSQIEVGRILGVKQGAVSLMERHLQPMTDEQMNVLAKFFDVHPAQLIDDPAWQLPASQLDVPLLKTLSQAVARILRKYPSLDDDIVGEIIQTLYQHYTSGNQPLESDTKDIEGKAEILVSHELAKRG